MSGFTNPRVPVTEEDKQKSYYKYFLEPMTPAPQEKYAKVLSGPLDPRKVLHFHDRNRLFEPGYLEEEIGYCVMPDGTGYVSNLTPMPGVTPEMFDWWFAWHGLDNLRYSIWDPEDHFAAVSMQKNKAKDPTLTLQEKYWDTTHAVLEDTGLGPENLFINFKRPGDLGFDQSRIGTPACATIVCAKGSGKGQPPFASPDTIMCHFIREIEGGIELRTRFWMAGPMTREGTSKHCPTASESLLWPQ